MNKKKLAIITTHPIQYNAPLFAMLNSRGKVYPKVFYTWSQARDVVMDKGFGHEIKWDIPLLEGYDFEFVQNTSKNPGNTGFFGIQSSELIRQIEAFNPDAILVFGWNFKSHLDAMRYFKGKVPVWFRGDSHLLDETPGLKVFGRRFLLRWIYAYIDKAFYVGIQNKAYHQKHGLREDQLVFAPHAVDNDRFIDDGEKGYEQKAKQKRKEMGYSEDDLVLLFAGKFEPKKNPMILVKALNLLRRESDKIKLLMVGSGLMEDELKFASLDNPNIQFLPFQNQSIMPIVYRIGDVYCLPSKGPKENWGLAVNEALACGRPVIVSRKVGCSSDLLVSDRIGWQLEDTSDINELSGIVSKISPCDIRNDSIKLERQDFIRRWSYTPFCLAIEELI